MQLNLDELSYDAKAYEFDGALLSIRPYPSSLTTVSLTATGVMISGDEQAKIFAYCLVGWDNVVGADGKALECTPDVKKKIFDFRVAGIPNFVLLKSRQFEEEKAAAEKK